MGKNSLLGIWSLISFEVVGAAGRIDYPYGRTPVGYILYTQNGFMSVSVMSSGRKLFAANEFAGIAGTQQEKAAAFDEYLTYSGRYETDGNRVVHRIEMSLFPNWVGSEIERRIAFDRDTLILTGLAGDDRATWPTVRITWKRAGV